MFRFSDWLYTMITRRLFLKYASILLASSGVIGSGVFLSKKCRNIDYIALSKERNGIFFFVDPNAKYEEKRDRLVKFYRDVKNKHSSFEESGLFILLDRRSYYHMCNSMVFRYGHKDLINAGVEHFLQGSWPVIPV